MITDKKLLFLINFFDGLGLGLAYPWLIFGNSYFSDDDIKEKWEIYNNQEGGLQLYLHTLFCETKCLYCNCISYVENEKSTFEKYKENLLNQIKKYSSFINKDLETIYFGGGTFSLWSENEMEDIIICIKNNFNLAKDYKWMVEIHPNSITKDKLLLLKKLGITDLMIGIQTTSEKLNKLNNRIYNRDKIENLINNIIEIKFDKIYFDLMYGLPYEDYDEVVNDMNFLFELGKKIKNNNIEANLELHRFNISSNVNYFNKIKNEKFDVFLKGFLEKQKNMDKIVNNYKENYLEKLFSSRRDEIVARKKNNTAILGIGTAAISYIPNNIYYFNEITNPKKWTNENKFKGYLLNSDDTLYSLFFNDIRYGIETNKLKSLVSKNNKLQKIFLENHNNLKSEKGRIFLNLKSDYELHLIILSIYQDKDKNLLYLNLLKKWEKLGYTKDELDNNIDTFLKLYY